MRKDNRTHRDRLTECHQCENCLIFFKCTKQGKRDGVKYCSLQCAGMAKRGIARPNHVLEIMSKSFIKKGQRLSPDTEFKKGEKPKGTACFKKGHIPHNKGIPFPKHIREKMGRAGPKGEKSHRWKGGYRNLQKERKRILADSYIKILLHHNRIKANEVTPEIIDLKRQAIIGHRTLKQFKKWRSENEQSNS